jgi:C1A family cysteine protease
MIYCNNIITVSKSLLNKLKNKNKTKLYKLNYVRDDIDNRDFKYKTIFKNPKKAISKLSNYIDHTINMSSVKNQGSLGSCVAFAVTAMKEWQEYQEHQQELLEGKRDLRKGKEYNLSEAWIYWNSKKIDPWPNSEGTSIRYALKVLNKIGVPTESAWPYNVKTIGKPKKWAKLIARWNVIKKYWRIDTLTELKLALIKSPVPIGIPCFEEIYNISSDGIIPYPKNPNNIIGGHAICCVGYDNNKKLVKFKNSWGVNWGENGYGYLSYKYLEDFLWDAWTCTDIKVTKKMLKETRNLYS